MVFWFAEPGCWLDYSGADHVLEVLAGMTGNGSTLAISMVACTYDVTRTVPAVLLAMRCRFALRRSWEGDNGLWGLEAARALPPPTIHRGPALFHPVGDAIRWKPVSKN